MVPHNEGVRCRPLCRGGVISPAGLAEPAQLAEKNKPELAKKFAPTRGKGIERENADFSIPVRKTREQNW